MQVFISRDGKQVGPFTQDELMLKIKTGEFTLNDWAWFEGMPEWKQLQVVMVDLGQAVQQSPSASSVAAQPDTSDRKGTMQISLPKGLSKMSAKFSPPKP